MYEPVLGRKMGPASRLGKKSRIGWDRRPASPSRRPLSQPPEDQASTQCHQWRTLILRSARRARLEGRKSGMQPLVSSFCPALIAKPVGAWLASTFRRQLCRYGPLVTEGEPPRFDLRTRRPTSAPARDDLIGVRHVHQGCANTRSPRAKPASHKSYPEISKSYARQQALRRNAPFTMKFT